MIRWVIKPTAKRRRRQREVGEEKNSESTRTGENKKLTGEQNNKLFFITAAEGRERVHAKVSTSDSAG